MNLRGVWIDRYGVAWRVYRYRGWWLGRLGVGDPVPAPEEWLRTFLKGCTRLGRR